MPGTMAPTLVEGLDDDVLVDVDAAGVDHEAALHGAHVLEARGGAADGDLVGLDDDRTQLDALGQRPVVDDPPAGSRETTSSTRTVTPGGS